jgi:two-component system, NtrC family, response regulator AlgB
MEVLLIDDDTSLRRTIRTALETSGHRVADARDSTQAVEMLGCRPFDVALLDLCLGREQGLELLRGEEVS